jgi:hypothetical protein
VEFAVKPSGRRAVLIETDEPEVGLAVMTLPEVGLA